MGRTEYVHAYFSFLIMSLACFDTPCHLLLSLIGVFFQPVTHTAAMSNQNRFTLETTEMILLKGLQGLEKFVLVSGDPVMNNAIMMDS